MHKLELHCHSAPVSFCAKADAKALVRKYLDEGYSGVVLTNHLNRATFRNMQDASWARKAQYFLDGFHAVRDAAGCELDVLLGCEVNLSPLARDVPYIPNDYLLYGVTEEWLRGCGDLRLLTLAELHAEARRAGCLLVHAHPFRTGTVMSDDRLLDGIEIFNGNPNHNSRNELAAAWAQQTGLIRTSGSDFHMVEGGVSGGIITEERIRTNARLLEVLRAGEGTLITR